MEGRLNVLGRQSKFKQLFFVCLFVHIRGYRGTWGGVGRFGVRLQILGGPSEANELWASFTAGVKLESETTPKQV